MAFRPGDQVDFPLLDGNDQSAKGTVKRVVGDLVAIQPQGGEYPVVVRQLKGAGLVVPLRRPQTA